MALFSYFFTGSGFISSDYYLHGFFSASIKLPKDYTAGVVVAFYVSTSTAPNLFVSFLGVEYTPISIDAIRWKNIPVQRCSF